MSIDRDSFHDDGHDDVSPVPAPPTSGVTPSQQPTEGTFNAPQPPAAPADDAAQTHYAQSYTVSAQGYTTPDSTPPYTPSYAAQPSEQSHYGQGSYGTYGSQNSYGYASGYTDASQAGGYGQFGAANSQTHYFQGGYGTVIPLRPLGIGDTLDAAFRLLKFNPVAYFIFPLIMGLIVGVFSAVSELLWGESSVATPMGSALEEISAIAAPSTIITVILSVIVQIFVTIVGTRVTIASVRGQKITLKESFALMRYRAGTTFARVLGFNAIIGAIFSAVVIVFIVIAALAAGPAILSMTDSSTVDTDSFPIATLGILLLILIVFMLFYLAMLVFYLRFALAPSAIVAEDIGPIRAIRRSWELTKGSFGYLIGTVLVVTLISGVIGSVVGGFFGIITTILLLSTSSTAASAALFISTLGASVAVSVALAPIECVLINLIYVNMRFRRENFHLRLIQETNGQG